MNSVCIRTHCILVLCVVRVFSNTEVINVTENNDYIYVKVCLDGQFSLPGGISAISEDIYCSHNKTALLIWSPRSVAV